MNFCALQNLKYIWRSIYKDLSTSKLVLTLSSWHPVAPSKIKYQTHITNSEINVDRIYAAVDCNYGYSCIRCRTPIMVKNLYRFSLHSDGYHWIVSIQFVGVWGTWLCRWSTYKLALSSKWCKFLKKRLQLPNFWLLCWNFTY